MKTISASIFILAFLIFANNTNAQRQKKKLIDLNDVTKKAIYLPQPRVPFNLDFPPNAIVKVRVVIDVLNGKVIEAKAVSGFQNLRSFAEEVARCARFIKTNDVQAKIVGYLYYKFDFSNRSRITDSNGGVLNSKAISLPQPVVQPNTDFSGVIVVRVNLDEEGNVISAKAVSGSLCLSETAVEAAKKAKFSKTLLSGKPVKVSGIIIYKFPVKN